MLTDMTREPIRIALIAKDKADHSFYRECLSAYEDFALEVYSRIEDFRAGGPRNEGSNAYPLRDQMDQAMETRHSVSPTIGRAIYPDSRQSAGRDI
jgi:hypothetical protein